MSIYDHQTVRRDVPVLSVAFYRDKPDPQEPDYTPPLACTIQQMALEQLSRELETNGADYVAGVSLANSEKWDDSKWSDVFTALRLLVPEGDGDGLWTSIEEVLKTVFEMGVEIGKKSQEAPG